MPENYVVYTDSACDIAPDTLKEWGVLYEELTFKFDDEPDKEYKNYGLPSKEFYSRMRQGRIAKTSAVNVSAFKEGFEPILKEGKDILYIGFSSGLSTTVNSAKVAADELKTVYPERKIICVDTLAASAGFGLLLYLTLQEVKKGATMEEAAKFCEDNKLKLCHWFTVDDLVYLKRGGRVSGAAAFIGGMLGIKPVLHVDNDGHLINMFKVRGRKTSLDAMADKYGELALNKGEGDTVFVSHGDCIEDVRYLESVLKEKYGVGFTYIADVGPVIGAHSGPGTMALFFLGKER